MRGFAGDRRDVRVGQPEHRVGVGGDDLAAALRVAADNDIACQQAADRRVHLKCPVRQRGVACTQDPVDGDGAGVDDARPLVRLVRSYLERERFRVIEAFHGRHALDAARAEVRMVWSRGQLLERLRGSPEYRDEHVIDVHVGNLRRKLHNPDAIATVRGVGYRMGAGR